MTDTEWVPITAILNTRRIYRGPPISFTFTRSPWEDVIRWEWTSA